jgi:glycosyltransferase involved in cell wall biosynthesis
MNLSLCITTFNRFELLKESYAQVIDDPRISEIIIVDDCSTESGIKEKVNSLAGGKVNVFHQVQNRGMSRNKADAISYASNEWAIIFDSDNVIGSNYLDAFFELAITGDALTEFGKITNIEKFIFCPDFAKPEFDYREYGQGGDKINNRYIYRSSIYGARECAVEIKHDNFNCLLNTCNYIVHRDFYLNTYNYNPNHIASDTIWHNYNHLKAGGHFVVVPGMQYYHRVHKGSGFLQGVDHNMRMQAEVRKMIMALK